MPTLFLDFDGVLHPEFCHESRHFCCLPVLEEVVRQVPDCELVITSTWRLQQPLGRLRERFSRDVAARIVGATPKIGDLVDVPQPLVSYEREAECHAWLRANDRAHLPWLAVDDRSWLYRPFCRSLFLVESRTGLAPLPGAQLPVSATCDRAIFDKLGPSASADSYSRPQSSSTGQYRQFAARDSGLWPAWRHRPSSSPVRELCGMTGPGSAVATQP